MPDVLTRAGASTLAEASKLNRADEAGQTIRILRFRDEPTFQAELFAIDLGCTEAHSLLCAVNGATMRETTKPTDISLDSEDSRPSLAAVVPLEQRSSRLINQAGALALESITVSDTAQQRIEAWRILLDDSDDWVRQAVRHEFDRSIEEGRIPIIVADLILRTLG